MQSDGNSFGGDVVLDGVKMAYRDEDNIFYANIFVLLLWRFKILDLEKDF